MQIIPILKLFRATTTVYHRFLLNINVKVECGLCRFVRVALKQTVYLCGTTGVLPCPTSRTCE